MSKFIPDYRSDIDGLRAVAVLYVLIFHAFPHIAPGGFIGVDIFFVISGFLITKILLKDFSSNKFSYRVFYQKRIKRIFPSLLVVMFATLVAGWFILLKDEYKQLGKHVLGGATFVSNFVLLNESGYFDTSSEYKPLLHLWSLGIEEQFYIFWPIILGFIVRNKKNFFVYVSGIFALSFLSGLIFTKLNSTLAFYSPFTRSWELLIGSFLAYFTLEAKFSRSKELLNKYRDYVSATGLIFIVLSFLVITKNKFFPGAWALLPSCGAALMIAAGPDAFFNKYFLSNKLFVKVGLISYPLYLWHWPLLSFLYITHNNSNAMWVTVALVLSFVLAALTYSLVENPIRFGQENKATKYLSYGMGIVASLGLVVISFRGIEDRSINELNKKISSSFKYPYVTSENCVKIYQDQPEGTFCYATGESPQVMLVGDSHANQLVGGLSKALGQKINIISVGNGAPLDEVQITLEKTNSHPWVYNLVSLNKNFNFIQKNPQLKVVILSAQWDALINGDFLNTDSKRDLGLISLVPKQAEEMQLSRDDLIQIALTRTIEKLQSRGIKVILVTDPPEIQDNIRTCRKYADGTTSCAKVIDRAIIKKRKEKFNTVIGKLKARFQDLEVFETYKYFCDDSVCRYFTQDDVPLYRDISHLSMSGVDLFINDLSATVLKKI